MINHWWRCRAIFSWMGSHVICLQHKGWCDKVSDYRGWKYTAIIINKLYIHTDVMFVIRKCYIHLIWNLVIYCIWLHLKIIFCHSRNLTTRLDKSLSLMSKNEPIVVQSVGMHVLCLDFNQNIYGIKQFFKCIVILAFTVFSHMHEEACSASSREEQFLKLSSHLHFFHSCLFHRNGLLFSASPISSSDSLPP